MPSATDTPMYLPVSAKLALQQTDNGSFPELLLGALDHIECFTWTDYALVLFDEYSLEKLLEFTKWLERHLPMVVAGPKIDPEAIVEVFRADLQHARVNRHRQENDSRKVDDRGRFMRNHLLLRKIKIDREIKPADLDALLRQEVKIASDRPLLYEVINVSRLRGKGGKIDVDLLVTALQTKGFELQINNPYSLETDVRRVLWAEQNRRPPKNQPGSVNTDPPGESSTEDEESEEIVPPRIEEPLDDEVERPKVTVPTVPVTPPDAQLYLVTPETVVFHERFHRMLEILVERFNWPVGDVVPLPFVRALVPLIWINYASPPTTILGNMKARGVIESLGHSSILTCWRYLPVRVQTRYETTLPVVTDERLVEIIEAAFKSHGHTLLEAVGAPEVDDTPDPTDKQDDPPEVDGAPDLTVVTEPTPGADAVFEARVEAEVGRRLKIRLREAYLSIAKMFTEMADEEKS